MEEAERELQRRRDRGRTAQAAFRKRQAKAAQEMRTENRKLKEALQSIVSAARADDRVGLLSVIKAAARVAGIDAEQLEVAHEHDDDTDSTGYASSHLQTTAPVRPSALNPNTKTATLATSPKNPKFDHFQANTTAFPFPAHYRSFDPLHYLRINIPPADIVPYLDSGRYTLAGQIFWSVLEHTIQCEHMHHPHVPADYTKLHPALARQFGHSKSLRSIRPAYFLAMAEARLEYLKRGSISGDYAAAAERDSADVLSKMVRWEYRSRGEDTSSWLSSLEIEWRFRTVLGDEVVRAMETVLKGPTAVSPYKAVMALVDSMTDNFVCFGDGPRWGSEFVDEVMNGWVETVSACALQKQCLSLGLVH